MKKIITFLSTIFCLLFSGSSNSAWPPVTGYPFHAIQDQTIWFTSDKYLNTNLVSKRAGNGQSYQYCPYYMSSELYFDMSGLSTGLTYTSSLIASYATGTIYKTRIDGIGFGLAFSSNNTNVSAFVNADPTGSITGLVLGGEKGNMDDGQWGFNLYFIKYGNISASGNLTVLANGDLMGSFKCIPSSGTETFYNTSAPWDQITYNTYGVKMYTSTAYTITYMPTTCSPTASATISLPSVSESDFTAKAIGDTVGEGGSATISLSCSSSTVVPYYYITDKNSIETGEYDYLTNTGTAEGVGIQLFVDNSTEALKMYPFVYQNLYTQSTTSKSPDNFYNSVLNTSYPYLHKVNSNKINISAKYVKTSDEVNVGTVHSIANIYILYD